MLNFAIIDDEIQACNELKDCLDFKGRVFDRIDHRLGL